MFEYLDHCLREDCLIGIEHADMVRPRLNSWKPWNEPTRYGGDVDALHDSIERCRRAHSDHHIRLNIEDMAWRSKLSLVVHRPH